MSAARFRPLVQFGTTRPDGALSVAGGPLWFTQVERLARDEAPRILPATQTPAPVRKALTAPRSPIAGLELDTPRIMGILNVTPDSFSDGGRHADLQSAQAAAQAMLKAGADLIDIGGESTRPGSTTIAGAEEITRTVPVIAALQAETRVPISIDTRKAAVAQAALDAGAALVNDVSAFTHDDKLAPLCAARGVPVCVMHSQGDPATMQDDPRYDDVLLDVYDALEERISALEAVGIARSNIIADPGIGFGKTLAHNLTLLRNIAVFHGLGCALLLGVSRKGFIGHVGQEPRADARAPGSIAVGLAALAQGVQFLRVHDVAETVQAVRLWQAVHEGGYEDLDA
ncbi:dihydropteroate synthase [Pontibaca salina]|uniref:Dihydropteroate synthase n=1 Tax=Pontibaca salina TaxID=2795731 RepID=A0A934M2D7_9RHOB|nr:dihydropteroate synthase [Pontibaca salina]MBI6630536.1 dihydropteroate synthase [Pontibaca salina]